MSNQKNSSEITSVSAQTSSNSAVADYMKPTKDVVVIELDANGNSPFLKNTVISGTVQVKELCNLKSDTRYILKTDAYIVSDTPNNVEMFLDGGNLYRYENVSKIPSKIVSINGSFIDVSETHDKNTNPTGLAVSQFIGVGENTSFKKMGPQTNYTVEFNMMDFVHSEDYGYGSTSRSICLNTVLKRIFDSLYNDYLYGNQKMVVKMPETHFGGANFFIDRPIDIPHNVTIDLSGAKVYVNKEFKKTKIVDGVEEEVDYQNEPFGSNYVFSFDTNELHPNLATSVVKDAEIVLDSDLVNEPNCPTVIFNLTHFSGIMENVSIDLSDSLKCVALWQPFGTSSVTYSDRKILRRCKVSNTAWRTDTPTVILCYGDGCIIEQCILGYVAIICGNSYAIKGCLNDSYFLYDTTVDFSGSYWEISQFQILDSNVRFASSKLNCQNNNFYTMNSSNARHYVGPWISVDTDDCRKRILNILHKFNLGDANFNEIKTVDTSNQYYRNYMGRATSRHSTVSFDPTIRSQQIYWGYRQPMSGPLLKVGDNARIIGIENLESIPSIFIHNSLNKETHFADQNTEEVSINAYNAATIPLVNGDFFNLKKDIAIPAKVTVNVTHYF